jgi:HTH-type transcriptional regulator/antitoxin HigA
LVNVVSRRGLLGLAARHAGSLPKTRPKVIECDRELDSAIEQLESLDFAGRALTAEERALRSLLAKLVEDYDARRHPLPARPPRQMLLFLMEQRSVRQRDLIGVFGSSSVASQVVNGKRSISKAHARRLAAFFGVSAELFF